MTPDKWIGLVLMLLIGLVSLANVKRRMSQGMRKLAIAEWVCGLFCILTVGIVLVVEL